MSSPFGDTLPPRTRYNQLPHLPPAVGTRAWLRCSRLSGFVAGGGGADAALTPPRARVQTRVRLPGTYRLLPAKHRRCCHPLTNHKHTAAPTFL